MNRKRTKVATSSAMKMFGVAQRQSHCREASKLPAKPMATASASGDADKGKCSQKAAQVLSELAQRRAEIGFDVEVALQVVLDGDNACHP